MRSQFSDLLSSHTYLFYLLKVTGHFTPTIHGQEEGGEKLAKIVRTCFMDGPLLNLKKQRAMEVNLLMEN